MASREAMAGICGSAFAKATADRFRGAFLFHYDLDLGLCERILEEPRQCRPRLVQGERAGSGNFEMQEKGVLALGRSLVKHFSMLKRKLPTAMSLAVFLHDISRNPKATQISMAMRGPSHRESTSCEIAVYSFRPVVDRPSVCAMGGQAARYPLTASRGGLRGEKL